MVWLLVLLNFVLILELGKPFPYTVWASADVLDSQTEWISALQKCGEYISKFRMGDEESLEAFMTFRLETVRSNVWKDGKIVSPLALKKVLVDMKEAGEL